VLVRSGKEAFYSVDKGVKAVGRAVEKRHNHYPHPSRIEIHRYLPTKTWLYPQLSTSYPHLGGKGVNPDNRPVYQVSMQGFPYLPTY